MKFATLSAAYTWMVWGAYKLCATYMGFKYPLAMHGWYNATHAAISALPWGFQFDNLVRDNFADGTLIYWEIWFGGGLLISLMKLCWRRM